MTSTSLKILHVEAGKHLYGGALQVLKLMEGLNAYGIKNVLACEKDSEIAQQALPFADVVPLRMGGDADCAMALRIASLVRRERPDLIHLHSRRGADFWGGLAARLTGVPCILTRRVDNPEKPWIVSVKYRLFDHVISISAGIRSVLLAEGLKSAQVSTVRSAVDVTPWKTSETPQTVRAAFGLPENALLIGMVAQLIRRKGHRHLLNALPSIIAAHPGAYVIMFGRGPLEDELRQEIQARGLADRVIMAGFRDDLPRWLGGIDVLCHPADMEGLGIALLQAAAAGIPVVASRAGGMPEAVLDGETGLLVPPGDHEALGRALCELLANSQLRQQFGLAGRKRMQSEFSIAEMVYGNYSIYLDCLLQAEERHVDRLLAHNR